MQSWLLVSCVMCDVSESSLDLNLSYCIENMSLTHNILVDARRLPVWSKATPLGWWTHLKIMKRGQRPYLHWVILRGFNPLIASRVPNPIRSGTCGSPGLPGKFFGDLLCKNTSQIHLNTTEISACPIFPLEKSSISFIQGGRYCLSKKIWWMNSVKLGFTPKGLAGSEVFDTQSIAIMALGQPTPKMVNKVPKISPKMGNGHSGFVISKQNLSILRS